MFIFNQSTNKLFNLDTVADVFIGRDGSSVSLGMVTGQINKLKDYNSEQEAGEAIAMLVEAIRMGKGEVFEMPDSETVRSRIQRIPQEKARHVAGKKTKGHGGS